MKTFHLKNYVRMKFKEYNEWAVTFAFFCSNESISVDFEYVFF